MQLATDAVRVHVPATSANLGPGFDSLGMALGLYDMVEVRALASTGITVTVKGEGAGQVPADGDHLVARAVCAALEYVGAPQMGLSITCTNAIPHGRGLGSSAAAVVAGMMAVRGLIMEPHALDNADILRLATEFEGHPDNAAPAIYGGATIAWLGDHGPQAVRIDISDAVAATVLIPVTQLATARARSVLPQLVPHRDAAATASRSALMVHALRSQLELLRDATQEWLHQDYRHEAMPDSITMMHSLRDAGLAAVISGAGPTVLVLSATSDHDDVKRIIAEHVTHQSRWSVVSLPVDRVGARVERIFSASQC